MAAFRAAWGRCIACLFLLVAQPVAATLLRTLRPAGQGLAKARPLAHVTRQATDMKMHKPSVDTSHSEFHGAASNSDSNAEGDGEDVRKSSRAAGDASVFGSKDAKDNADDDAVDQEVHVGNASPRSANLTVTANLDKVVDETQKHVTNMASDTDEVVAAAGIEKAADEDDDNDDSISTPSRAVNTNVAEQSFTTRNSKKVTPSSMARAIAHVENEAHTPLSANVAVQSFTTSNAEKMTSSATARAVGNAGMENEKAKIRSSIASALAAHSAEEQDDFLNALHETQQIPAAKAEDAVPLDQRIPDATMSTLDAELASS